MNNGFNKRLILASASPRRRELLSIITDDFEIITREIDERRAEIYMENKGTPAVRVSEGLAFLKAKAVFDELSEEQKANVLVIGADTSVILDNEIFGKPKDKEEAISMLTRLSGKTHVVATGVALITSEKTKCFTEVTPVEFCELDQFQKDLIESYCSTDEPYDKAGAYGIQSGGATLVKKIDGDFSNVVGLPVSRLAREIESVIR